MSTCVTAIEHLRRLRGGSQPHLLLGSDGGYYVTKFSNNPQHIRVLANEMFAGQVAQRLGLPVATPEVIDVPEWFIRETPELCMEVIQGTFSCSAGKQLASRYLSDPEMGPVYDYLPDQALEKVTNLADFPRVLVLDKWTANCDGRQVVFTPDSIFNDRYVATFVDQGFCFNAGEWNFPDAPLRGAYSRNCVYRNVTGWEAFEPALSRAEQMGLDELWHIAYQIPEEWYEHDVEGLSRITEALYRRRSKIRGLITDFRKSTRNPFPNWGKRSTGP
jgi:hypothetical protein